MIYKSSADKQLFLKGGMVHADTGSHEGLKRNFISKDDNQPRRQK